ncbi:uncharacterized protein LOC135828942 [Sycon ciliatum]|uniref:uncharacterized protein LOC135828942 n=1 Tax=Sycon ciliatum TaxID=27933 RepID=UPI0031F70BEA
MLCLNLTLESSYPALTVRHPGLTSRSLSLSQFVMADAPRFSQSLGLLVLTVWVIVVWRAIHTGTAGLTILRDHASGRRADNTGHHNLRRVRRQATEAPEPATTTNPEGQVLTTTTSPATTTAAPLTEAVPGNDQLTGNISSTATVEAAVTLPAVDPNATEVIEVEQTTVTSLPPGTNAAMATTHNPNDAMETDPVDTTAVATSTSMPITTTAAATTTVSTGPTTTPDEAATTAMTTRLVETDMATTGEILQTVITMSTGPTTTPTPTTAPTEPMQPQTSAAAQSTNFSFTTAAAVNSSQSPSANVSVLPRDDTTSKPTVFVISGIGGLVVLAGFIGVVGHVIRSKRHRVGRHGSQDSDDVTQSIRDMEMAIALQVEDTSELMPAGNSYAIRDLEQALDGSAAAEMYRTRLTSTSSARTRSSFVSDATHLNANYSLFGHPNSLAFKSPSPSPVPFLFSNNDCTVSLQNTSDLPDISFVSADVDVTYESLPVKNASQQIYAGTDEMGAAMQDMPMAMVRESEEASYGNDVITPGSASGDSDHIYAGADLHVQEGSKGICASTASGEIRLAHTVQQSTQRGQHQGVEQTLPGRTPQQEDACYRPGVGHYACYDAAVMASNAHCAQSAELRMASDSHVDAGVISPAQLSYQDTEIVYEQSDAEDIYDYDVYDEDVYDDTVLDEHRQQPVRMADDQTWKPAKPMTSEVQQGQSVLHDTEDNENFGDVLTDNNIYDGAENVHCVVSTGCTAGVSQNTAVAEEYSLSSSSSSQSSFETIFCKTAPIKLTLQSPSDTSDNEDDDFKDSSEEEVEGGQSSRSTGVPPSRGMIATTGQAVQEETDTSATASTADRYSYEEMLPASSGKFKAAAKKIQWGITQVGRHQQLRPLSGINHFLSDDEDDGAGDSYEHMSIRGVLPAELQKVLAERQKLDKS